MKALSIAAWILFGLAAVALVVSVPVENGYVAKSNLIQRVQISEADRLFGSQGTPVGSPAQYIIEDEKAFVGSTDDGTRLVDQAYLDANGIYPLQLKSVQSTIGYVRIGAIAAAFIFGAVGILAWRKAKTGSLAVPASTKD
jgi:hypothetical protein